MGAIMNQSDRASWIAFAGTRRIHSGMPADVARAAKLAVDGGEQAVLVFDDASRVVDIDYRGSDEDVITRLGLADDASTRSNGNGGRRGCLALPREPDTTWPRASDGSASSRAR